MTTRFIKGAALPLTSIVLGVSAFFATWNAYNSKLAIETSTSQAAVLQWQEDAGRRFDTIEKGIDNLNSKVDLMAPHFGFNPAVVEYISSTTVKR